MTAYSVTVNSSICDLEGAPRYRVVRTSLKAPDFNTAEEVLGESERRLTALHTAKDRVFVDATHNGSDLVMQVDPARKEKPKRLTLPENLTGYVRESSPFFQDIHVATVAWTKNGGLHTYDPETGQFHPSTLQPAGAFDDVPGYTSIEVEVPSHDGVLVPLSIIYKLGLELDGSHPLLLSGYGAYGSIRFVS